MLVMGLGNPGTGYQRTRHNVGYLTTDILMEEPPLRFRRRLFSSAGEALLNTDDAARNLVIVRYDGFMNSSGVILPRLLRKYRAGAVDLCVVVDNMDLPPGAVRLRRGGGTAGHNGLKSIVSSIGDSDFTRLYIGVGRPSGGDTVVEHVLGVPDAGESELIQGACRRGAEAIRRLTSEKFDRIAEEYNRRGS